MTRIERITLICLAAIFAGCGGDKGVDSSCDEARRYQSVGAGKKIEVPEGLDPLNELAEMPIPKAQDAPERPKGSRCIELPPPIRAGSQ